MGKVNLNFSFDEEKLAVLEFSLKKENTTVQRKMSQALTELYEKTVPQALREYLDSRPASAARPRRPARQPAVHTSDLAEGKEEQA